MRLLVAAGLLLLATLLQSLAGQHLPVIGSRPDVPLVVVLAWAMLRGSSEGATAGFLGGLLLDSVSYTPFGLHGALMGLAGYLTGLMETNFYRGNVGFFLGTAALATLVYHTAAYLGLQALGHTLPPVDQVVRLAVPAAVLNALLLIPVFLLCRRLLRALAGWRELQV